MRPSMKATAILVVILAGWAGAGDGVNVTASAQSPLSPSPPPRTAPPLPGAGSDASGAYIGDVLYVHLGDRRPASGAATSARGAALYSLSPGDTTWTTVWTGSAARGAVLVGDGRDLYRVGGAAAAGASPARSDLERWSWTDGQWVGLTPMPDGRTDHAAVVVGREIWVIGGWEPSVHTEDLRAIFRAPTVPLEDWRDDVLVADLDADPVSWNVIEDVSLRLHSLAAAFHGDAIWVAGGMTPAGPRLEAYRLDPRTRTLAPAPVPTARSAVGGVGLGMAATGGVLYASNLNQLFRLDPDERAWRALAYDVTPTRVYNELVGGPDTLHIVGGASGRRTHAVVDRVEVASLRPSDVVEVPRRPEDMAADRPVLAGEQRWPGFRGPAYGHSQALDLPLVWSDERNLAWRYPIGGYGQSSPVVWDGTVFVTAIDGPLRETQMVDAVDLETGALRWRHALPSTHPVEVTDVVARGSPTPWVDAERVYYLFESGDLGALDHDGEPVWSRSLKTDYGEIEGYGLGSSLAANAETLFLLAGHEGPSYLLAVDKATGETRWKADHRQADRPLRSSWTTPIVVPSDAGELVVVSITGMLDAHDAESGERVWWLDGLSGNRIPSPVLAGRRLVVPSMDSRSNLALSVEHRGRLLDEQVFWRGRYATTSMSSPVATGEAVYFTNSRGVLRSLDLGSGESRWATRLASVTSATPIVNGDRLYVFGDDGTTSVFAVDAAEPIELARNTLRVSERVYGVAAVDGALLVRTGRELIRIGHGSARETQR